MNEVYDALNKEWKNACRMIFGQEAGELETYEKWLLEYNEAPLIRKSSATGKEIAYAVPYYRTGAKFSGFEEIDFQEKFAPLSINEIKDIDSAIVAIKERVIYTGNIVLGNSDHVFGSSNVSDSYFIYKSGRVDASKYIAYSMDVRLAERAFGCVMLGRGNEYVIKILGSRLSKRCFESWHFNECADCYYVSGCDGCHDCIFSFNLNSRAFCIGNLVLTREKYSKVKAQLIEQLASELENKKRLPSLMEIIRKCKGKPPSLKTDETQGVNPPGQRKEIIDQAFSKTCQVVLGRPLGTMDSLKHWLERNTYAIRTVPSAMSGIGALTSNYPPYLHAPLHRMVKLEEAYALEETIKISEKEALSITLHNAHEKIAPVAYMTIEKRVGIFENNIDDAINIDSVNCYRCSPSVEAKFCGYCFWPRNCEYVFGSQVLFQSTFCLKCYNSVKLIRCFEVDSSRDCSDCYFSHNIEGCQDCMFCFNVKSKRYAIGNVELPKGEYLRIKKFILAEIAVKLEKNKDLPLDIYNLGAK